MLDKAMFMANFKCFIDKEKLTLGEFWELILSITTLRQ